MDKMDKAKHKLPSDMIELSDLFRRSVIFGNQDTAKELVDLVRNLGCAITYLRPEDNIESHVNRTALKDIAGILAAIDDAASMAGMRTVVLPLHEDDPFAAIMRDKILDEGTFTVQFGFRTEDYDRDLDSIGFIDGDIPTFLDEGIRGLGAIDSELKYKWNRDLRQGGQLNLDI